MCDLNEAHEIAKVAWKNSPMKSSLSRKKCPRCFDNWQRNGCKAEQKPPYFPADYEENCPVCKSELSRPGIPF